MKIVILAGGIGTRLWPLSKNTQPKHIVSVTGKDSMLKRTYAMLCLRFKPSDIFVVTSVTQKRMIMRQLPRLPEKNIFAEPMRKESGGAIGLAGIRIHKQNPKEVVIVGMSDSWVSNEKKFMSYVSAMGAIARKHPEYSVLLGVKPSYPETGYGYMQVNKKFARQSARLVYSVKRFIEKPHLARAKKFVSDKNYYWNPGWFAWRVDTLLDLYKKHTPKNFSILERIGCAPESSLQKTINKEFPKLEPLRIEWSTLEKTKDILVLPIDIAWSDIGHWRNVHEMSQKDKDGNTTDSASVLLNSRNNFFSSQSGKLVAAIGIDNLALVETKDVILLLNKDQAQDVKLVVAQLKNRNLKKYL